MPRPRYFRLEAARRNAIFDAAVAEFGAHGYDKASYNQIIERAGLSKGAMYYYFDDKEDLYGTIVSEAMKAFIERLGSFPRFDDRSSFWDGVYALYQRCCEYFNDQPALGQLMWSVAADNKRKAQFRGLEEVYLHFGNWTREMVEEGRRLGAIRRDLPVDFLVNLLMAATETGDQWYAGEACKRLETPSELNEMAHAMGDAHLKMMVDLMRRLSSPAEELGLQPLEMLPFDELDRKKEASASETPAEAASAELELGGSASHSTAPQMRADSEVS